MLRCAATLVDAKELQASNQLLLTVCILTYHDLMALSAVLICAVHDDSLLPSYFYHYPIIIKRWAKVGCALQSCHAHKQHAAQVAQQWASLTWHVALHLSATVAALSLVAAQFTKLQVARCLAVATHLQ
jgi:hypothetical protein